ncbi:zincin-like metallopeptidase domain-containing protein, partial [Rhizorhabdus dicambivorans]
GFWAVLEAPMDFTFQPPFLAGLSGYVAEIGSGLICAHLDLPNELHDNHASYVAHWLGILRADKTAIIHAASKAEQAFNYLLAFGDSDDTASSAEGVRQILEAA